MEAFHARTGQTFAEAAASSREARAFERSTCETLERRRKEAARQRDEARTRCSEAVAACKAAEKAVEEQKAVAQNERHLRRLAEAALAQAQQRTLQAEGSTRVLEAALATEEQRKHAGAAEVKRLTEELRWLSMTAKILHKQRDELFSVVRQEPIFGPAMPLRDQILCEKAGGGQAAGAGDGSHEGLG